MEVPSALPGSQPPPRAGTALAAPPATPSNVTGMSQLHLPGSGARGCQSPFLPGPAAASHHKWVWPAKKQQRNTHAQQIMAHHGSAPQGIDGEGPRGTAAAPARRQLRELSLLHTGKLSLPSAGNVVSDGSPWCDTHCVPTGLRRALGRRQNPRHKLQTQLLLHGTVPEAPTSRVLPSSRAHPHPGSPRHHRRRASTPKQKHTPKESSMFSVC